MNLVTEEEDTTGHKKVPLAITVAQACLESRFGESKLTKRSNTAWLKAKYPTEKAYCVDVSPIVTTDTLCSDWVSPQTILETPPQSTPVKHVKDDTAAVVVKPTTSVVKVALPVKITKPAPTVKVQKKQVAQAVLHIYIIEKGDTFYSIARKLKIDVKKLREFNPGMYKILNPGDEIRYWKTYQ